MDRRAHCALISALALAACRSPTQISVTVRTDVPCANVTSTSFTSGELGKIEADPPTTESLTCTDGHLGTVVLVPSTDDDAEVGFKVVTALNGESLDECASAPSDTNCIVARRGLRYLPHTSLDVIVDMSQTCEGIVCDPQSTCVDKVCKSAKIPDPSACQGTGCTANVLGPAVPEDAGADDAAIDATVSDAGGDATTSGAGDATVDATVPDAATDASDATPPDAGDASDASDGASEDSAVADSGPFDAGTFDATVVGCDLGGLQPGAAYAMESYCPSGRNRSPVVGPSAPVQKWFIDLYGFGYASPSVGADGTVYVASVGLPLPDGGNGYIGGAVQGVHPDGTIFWTYAPDAGSSFDQVPVIAADSTLRFWDLASSDYTVLALDGGLRGLVKEGSNSRGGLTIVSGGTMYVPDNNGALNAYAGDGSTLWNVPSVGTDYCFPTVNASGDIFSETNENNATALHVDAGIAWQTTFDSGSAVSENPSPAVVAPDGSLRMYDGNGDLWSLDALSGHENWHHNYAAPGDISGLAVADDGTTYLSTRNALFHISAAGGTLNNPTGDFGAPVIDANGDVYAYCNSTDVCSYDATLVTRRWEYTLPNPLGYDFGGKIVLGPGGRVYVITTTIGVAGRLHALGQGP